MVTQQYTRYDEEPCGEADGDTPLERGEAESTPQPTHYWYVYMVRCRDHSLYTGITTDVAKRVSEHNGSDKGARYTRGRRPVVLVYQEQSNSRSSATRRERQIKQLTSSRKRRLVAEKDLQGPHDIHPDC